MSEIKTAYAFLITKGVKSVSDTFTAFQVERMLDEYASQFKPKEVIKELPSDIKINLMAVDSSVENQLENRDYLIGFFHGAKAMREQASKGVCKESLLTEVEPVKLLKWAKTKKGSEAIFWNDDVNYTLTLYRESLGGENK